MLPRRPSAHPSWSSQPSHGHATPTWATARGRPPHDARRRALSFSEEIAQVFGVPFEIVPFKGTDGPAPPKPKRFHVVALESRSEYEIRFPRVEGYTQGVRNKVTVRDWSSVPTLRIDEEKYPALSIPGRRRSTRPA